MADGKEKSAGALLNDYFDLNEKSLLKRYFSHRSKQSLEMPASKKRLIVHRVAWLVAIEREAPESILVLAFNRSTVGELRQRLIAGFRFILVDEYQDINQPQYRFLSALAGRTLENEAEQLTMFAVGDDDQNIYEWNGAENRYIHQFGNDYHARIEYMTENYRSCRQVVQVSNRMISRHPDRLKADYSITAANASLHGTVRLYQGSTAALHQKTLSLCLAMVRDDHVAPINIAILCRQHQDYQPLASLLRSAGLPLCLINKKPPYRWEQLREVQAMINVLDGHDTLTAGAIIRSAWLAMPEQVHLHRSVAPLWNWLAVHEPEGTECVSDQLDRIDQIEQIEQIVRSKQEWRSELWELAKSESKKTGQGIWLGTMHSVKGLEFERVIVYAGAGETTSNFCEELRLRYVAMTRAKQQLILMQDQGSWFSELGVETESLPLEAREDSDASDVYYCGMDSVDMDFAGRMSCSIDTSRLHEQSELELNNNSGALSWNKQAVGRLSRHGLEQLRKKTQQGWHIDSVNVQAIVRRQRKDISDEKYLARCKQDCWDVILPEIHLCKGYWH